MVLVRIHRSHGEETARRAEPQENFARAGVFFVAEVKG
jgi:hypothetical protein